MANRRNIVMKDNTWNELVKVAEEMELSRSAVIRIALKEYFEKRKKLSNYDPIKDSMRHN